MQTFYIPKVLPTVTAETIKSTFEHHGIGPISHVDLVERFNNNDGTNCKMAYVHFKETKFDIPAKSKFISEVLFCDKLKDPKSKYKMWYTAYNYWICLPDKSTRKPDDNADDVFTAKEKKDEAEFIDTMKNEEELTPEWIHDEQQVQHIVSV